MQQSNRPTVALVYGFWGQNIGNAFFNVGGKWIVEQMFPEHDVIEIQDQPGYRTFHNQSKGNPKRDLGLLDYLDTDYVVLQGPMFTKSFRALWEPTFEKLRARGVKVVLLSAAFFHYDDEEIDSVRGFLKEYPPVMISTRDGDSYEHVHDLAELTYSGIDSAFFWPLAYRPAPLAIEPYITINFDQYPEPDFTVAESEADLKGKFDKRFSALGRAWGAKQPWLQKRFSKAGQWQCYLGALIDFRRLPERIADHLVVRPDHRVNPHITWKVYNQANAVGSDEPFTYFTMYSQTQLTLSDRVHACVATLAAGGPAMLYHPTPRARLFERVGLTEIREQPVELDLAYLDEERQTQIATLRELASQTLEQQPAVV
ncbi:MAG: polysaccharide pyruvyl transferase family protein [Planctomycetota bacterium]